MPSSSGDMLMSQQVKGVLVISCVAITALVAVALFLTHLANAREVRGMGNAALGIWVIIVFVAGAAVWRKHSAIAAAVLVPCWCIAAVLLYVAIGYYAFGWIGLMKP